MTINASPSLEHTDAELPPYPGPDPATIDTSTSEDEEPTPTAANARQTQWSNLTRFSSSGDIVFAFGPDTDYFMGARGQGRCWLLSNASLHNDSTREKEKGHISRFYLYAMSPHEDEYAAYYNTQTKAINLVFRASGKPQAPSYQSLRTFLDDNVTPDIPSVLETYVVFGPGASYYARCGNECIWNDLPKDLEAKLKRKKTRYERSIESSAEDEETKSTWIPRILALGADDHYFAVWDNDDYMNSLPESSGFTKSINKTNISNLVNVVLSPTESEYYFTLVEKGTIAYYMGMDRDGLAKRKMLAYLQMRAREDGTTFQRVSTKGNTTTSFAITPETNFGQPEPKKSEDEQPKPKISDTDQSKTEDSGSLKDTATGDKSASTSKRRSKCLVM